MSGGGRGSTWDWGSAGGVLCNMPQAPRPRRCRWGPPSSPPTALARPGNPRLAESGPRFPVPGRSGTGPYPDSRFPATRESGVGKSPEKRENGGSDSRFPSDVRASTAVNSDKVWVDIVRKVRPRVHHPRDINCSKLGQSLGRHRPKSPSQSPPSERVSASVHVVILHRPVLGSLRRWGGGQNLHSKDLRQPGSDPHARPLRHTARPTCGPASGSGPNRRPGPKRDQEVSSGRRTSVMIKIGSSFSASRGRLESRFSASL